MAEPEKPYDLFEELTAELSAAGGGTPPAPSTSGETPAPPPAETPSPAPTPAATVPHIPSEPTTPPAASAVTSEEAPFDPATPLTPREQELLARLERLTGEKLELSKLAATSQPSSAPGVTPEAHNFLEGLDFNDVFSSAENFNKLLLQVYNKGLERAATLTAENIMRTLPETISMYVAQNAATTQMINQFYVDNADLVNVKSVVADVANEIAANHPEYTLPQIFDAAAVATRGILKLRAPDPVATPSAPPRPTVPRAPTALPGQRGASGRFRAPDLVGLEKEIHDLLVDKR